MTVYKRLRSQPFKWVLALIVFLVAISITFADVHGTDFGNSGSNGNETVEGGDSNTSGTDRGSTPMAIPEPTTLLLVAGGLSALYLARRKRK